MSGEEAATRAGDYGNFAAQEGHFVNESKTQ